MNIVVCFLGRIRKIVHCTLQWSQRLGSICLVPGTFGSTFDKAGYLLRGC